MSRMVGGTFGVAVTGALVTAIGKSRINNGLPHLPTATRSAIANALGSGASPDAHGSAHVASVVREAFVSALGTGLTIGARGDDLRRRACLDPGPALDASQAEPQTRRRPTSRPLKPKAAAELSLV